MRIIKNCDAIEVICSCCRSTLEISRNDIKYFYCFGHDSYYYVECCACFTRCKVLQNKVEIPERWKGYLKSLLPDD